MPLIRERLLEIYEREGFTVQAGHMMVFYYDTKHLSNLRECASLWRDGKRVGTGWGMAWGELTLFEWLGDVWRPATIFGIGNAFGWSTVAMKLAFPLSRLAVLDAGVEGSDNRAGITLTNAILADLGGGEVVYGHSSQDVPAAVEKLKGLINLVFIDGAHSVEQQATDFAAIEPFLAPDHIVLFHDVVCTQIEPGFLRIAAAYDGRSAVLSRTTTGIGIVWSAEMSAIASRLTHLFVQPYIPEGAQWGRVR